MKTDSINFIITLALAAGIGMLAGYGLGFYRANAINFPEIRLVDEINPGIATIKLYEVSGGKLVGKLAGQKARIAYSANNILELKAGETFEIPLNQVSLSDYYATDTIPEGALFMASSSGKYYYSVFDKRALRIAKKNRLYFGSEQEAINMGYQKK